GVRLPEPVGPSNPIARPEKAPLICFRIGRSLKNTDRLSSSIAGINRSPESLLAPYGKNHKDTKTQRKAARNKSLMRPFFVSLCFCGSSSCHCICERLPLVPRLLLRPDYAFVSLLFLLSDRLVVLLT